MAIVTHSITQKHENFTVSDFTSVLHTFESSVNRIELVSATKGEHLFRSELGARKMKCKSLAD